MCTHKQLQQPKAALDGSIARPFNSPKRAFVPEPLSLGICRYLLPPIIFYAGLSVKKKRFFRNVITISSFGIIGTYVAFAVIASVLYGISLLPNILELSVRPRFLARHLNCHKNELGPKAVLHVSIPPRLQPSDHRSPAP